MMLFRSVHWRKLVPMFAMCDWPTFDSAPIAHLLAFGSPVTVGRLVIAVVVESIQARAGRALAHIGQEVLEMSPAITIRDPAGGVITILVPAFSSASL
jgi:hypothetical protein